jgi:uncharacterized protein (DUF302 family)
MAAKTKATLILVPLLAFAALEAARAQCTGERIDVQSRKNFKATVDNLTTALKREGMMVVATIDHQNMLKMVGASIKGSKTIEFGKPDMGKMLLPMAPEVGLEMPGKIYVWEKADGTTAVSYRKVAPLYGCYGNQKVAEAGMMMDMMVEKLIRGATQ